MFGKSFGVYSVMGNFGSGKTSGTFLDLSKYDKRKTYIIANVKYSFVDRFFNTSEELNQALNAVINYCKVTNKDIKKYYDEREKYKDIVIVVDEAHLYFDARKRKDYSGVLDVILSQCRKRNIKCFFVSQRLKRVDLNIRRLSDFVIRYSRTWKPILPGIERVNRYVYSNEWDLADIQGDDAKTYIMNWENQKVNELEASEIEKSHFSPLLKIRKRYPFGNERGKLASEKHNTLFISWLDSERANEADPFLKEILVEEEKTEQKREIPKTQKEKNIDKIKYYLPTFYMLYEKYVRSSSLPRRRNKLNLSAFKQGIRKQWESEPTFIGGNIQQWGRDAWSNEQQISDNIRQWSRWTSIKSPSAFRAKSI